MGFSLLLLAALLLPSARSDAPRFAAWAEGFTAARGSGPITVWARAFSVPEIPALCAAAPRPSRLDPMRGPGRLRIGDAFPLNRLVVTAADAAGRPLRKVPILVEVEYAGELGVFDTGPYTRDAGLLVAVAPGQTRIRVRTLCDEPPLEALFAVTVRPR